MNRTIVLAVLVLVSAPATTRAGIEMHLTPLPGKAVTPEGFTQAELRISDANDQLPTAAQAMTLRRLVGGPTMFYEDSIAPGAEGSFRVLLPMISARQTYVVRLLTEASPTSPVLLEQKVTAETDDIGSIEVARKLLLDSPAYDDYIEDLPRWPTWTVRNALLVSLLMLVGMGATLLLRRPFWRLAAAVLVLAVTSGTLYANLSNCPLVIARRNGNIWSVSCRRTATWTAPTQGLGPIYWRTRQMDQDNMVYQPAKTLTLTLRANEVRLFRHRPTDKMPRQSVPE